jgi:CcdB protein
MQRYDVCRTKRSRTELVVILQHDATSHLATCIVAPLVPIFVPEREGKIRPVLHVNREAMQLQTDRLAAIPGASIGSVVVSVAPDQDIIMNAIHRLFIGF